MLKRVRDYAQIKGNGTINRENADAALRMLEIDDLGLDELDRTILKEMITKYNGGPVGIETLSLLIGEDKRTIEEVYEPYLVKIGFIKRTQRGRVVTDNAYGHLGIELREDRNNKLF